ncbi:unnamed protein product [Alternaria alternata]
MNYNMLDQGFSNTTMLPKHSTAPGLVTKPGSLHLQARNHQELMTTMLSKHSTAPGLAIKPGSLRLQARNHQELMMVTMLPKHSTPAVCLVQAPIAVAFVGPQGAGKSLLLWLGGCCAPYRRCWSPEPSCSVSLSWLLATAKTSRTVLTFSSFQTLSTSSLSSLPSYTGNEHASAFASQTLNVGHTYWYYVSRALSG